MTTVLQAVPTQDGTGDSVLSQFSLLKGKREYLSPTTCYTLETANTKEKITYVGRKNCKNNIGNIIIPENVFRHSGRKVLFMDQEMKAEFIQALKGQ